jgi:hypothetical protein
VAERRSCNERITKRHAAPLAKANRCGDRGLRYREHVGRVEKCFQKPTLVLAQLMVAQRLDLADDRYVRGLTSNKPAEYLVSGRAA